MEPIVYIKIKLAPNTAGLVSPYHLSKVWNIGWEHLVIWAESQTLKRLCTVLKMGWSKQHWHTLHLIITFASCSDPCVWWNSISLRCKLCSCLTTNIAKLTKLQRFLKKEHNGFIFIFQFKSTCRWSITVITLLRPFKSVLSLYMCFQSTCLSSWIITLITLERPFKSVLSLYMSFQVTCLSSWIITLITLERPF